MNHNSAVIRCHRVAKPCARIWQFTGLIVATLLLSQAALAQPESVSLADLSLEELANLDITSVAKKATPLSQTPAAIYVITASAIRRSGAASVPEALRLAPNLLVARIDSGNYAISARGFNGLISNKLQVLLDGRELYTPLFSGVFWDVQDVLLDDIDRIEVISGPAAAQWGGNAVNGVINIISRSSAETTGTLLQVNADSRDHQLAARYGGAIGDNGYFRLYSKLVEQEPSQRRDDTDKPDALQRKQAGFRLDWSNITGRVQVQGDAYRGTTGQFVDEQLNTSGANLAVRWRKQMSNGGNINVNAYHDYTKRVYPDGFAQRLHSSQLDMLHNLPAVGIHQVQWGLEYRLARDSVQGSAMLTFLPNDITLTRLALFAQDQLTLQPDLTLTLNARLEHNDYTGAEWMPGVRLAWQPSEQQLWWGAISRAVRTPSRIDRQYHVPGQEPFILRGGPDFISETANVYQLGYRALFGTAFSWSATLFYSEYNHLRTLEPDTQQNAFVIGNGMQAESSGVESWATYQASDNWRLSAGLLLLEQQFRLKPGSQDVNQGSAEGNDPSYQWQLRSQWQLGDDKELDLLLRQTGALSQPEVPAYLALDLWFGWQLYRQLQLSVFVHNALDDSHAEFGSAAQRSEFDRRLGIGLRWSF